MIRYFYTRRFITILMGSIMCATAYAQHTTNFKFVETAPTNIRQTMQNNAEAVFAEINRAHNRKKEKLNLSTANATEEAISRIQSLWTESHFYCTETDVIQRVLMRKKQNNSIKSYQVRNIPVFFDRGRTDEYQYQDIVIEFTPLGKISDMIIPIGLHQYKKIILEAQGEVADFRHREMILDFIESLRTAYNSKNTAYIEHTLSDYALIITGKVLQPQLNRDVPKLNETKVVYVTQDKTEYLKNLKNAFNKNEYINIKFEEIKLLQHGGNPNIYGVTLRQKWNSSSYRDDGWLFLMIDFTDEDNPLIWVRTWQPYEKTSKDEVFGLDDFHVRY